MYEMNAYNINRELLRKWGNEGGAVMKCISINLKHVKQCCCDYKSCCLLYFPPSSRYLLSQGACSFYCLHSSASLFWSSKFTHKDKPQCQPIGPHLRNLGDRFVKQRMNRTLFLKYVAQTALSLKDALSYWFWLK